MRFASAVLVLTFSAAAQGVLPLSGTYRLGGIGSYLVGTCPSASTPGIVGQDGTVVFGADGSQNASVADYEVCAGGTVLSGQPGLNTGTYQVLSNGLLIIDDDPTAPGTDILVAHLRADGSFAVISRDREDDTAELVVLVALSSGHTLASLSGNYHVTRLLLQNPATGMAVQSDLGVMRFDGAGGFTESGRSQGLTFGGTVGSSRPYSAAGSYQVAADGSLTMGQFATGAITPDAELFYWLRLQGTDIELTVGVRQAAAYSPLLVSGASGIAGLDLAIGSSGVNLQTEFGALTFVPPTAVTGSLFHVDTTVNGNQSTTIPISGGFTLANDGVLGLPLGVPGALSADGSLLLGAPRGNENVGLWIGVAAAAWPTPIGTGLAGAGRKVPLLLPLGGFPHTGNSSFGLLVAQGVGSAPTVLAIAAQPVVGGLPLLGGLAWIDPNQLVASFSLVLSGPAGVAGIGTAALALPVPPIPWIGGASLAAQAFVLDPAAVQGVAMTAGLGVVVCRG